MWKRALFPSVLAVLFASGAPSSQLERTYWQDGACALIDLGGNASLEWCVATVAVTASGHLEVSVRWRASGLSGGTLEKGADTGNTNMYLMDNSGNRYDHVATRGASASGGLLKGEHDVLEGVFVFPAPRIGASEFSFHDDDQRVVISGITSSEQARSDRSLSASVLGRVTQTEAIQIEYSWGGLRGRFQEGYSLQATEGGFRAEGVHDDEAVVTGVGALVPTSAIESFLAMLAEAPVLVREYVPHVTHTNDYPSITVELRLSRDSIVFFSQSQGIGHVPWGIDSGGKVYVVPDDTPARALQIPDPFLGRDLASRARKFLAPHVGDERAVEIWAELEENLGTEDAYKKAFRLQELLGGEEDSDVLTSLEAYLERQRASRVQLPREAAPNAVLPNGDSALAGAARAGELSNLEMLLGRGMDPNERSELDGHTALIAAALANHTDAVRVLLSAGADPSVRSRSGETALTLAAASNRVETVRALLDPGPDIDINVDINIKGRDGKTPLMQAAENGYTEVVVALLDANATVDSKGLRGNTALGLAAENRHLPVVRILLDAGANPNLRDRYRETPLMTTLHPGIARALIRAGADVDAVDEQGSTSVMRLSAGEGAQTRNPDGGGPKRGSGVDRLGTLQALLSAGADVDAKDQQGRTALIWSTNGVDSHPELLPILIAAGANVDANDSKGATALLYASIHGHIESARILIDAGADVNVRMGRTTALGFALEHEHGELVTLLLRSGARR